MRDTRWQGRLLHAYLWWVSAACTVADITQVDSGSTASLLPTRSHGALCCNVAGVPRVALRDLCAVGARVNVGVRECGGDDEWWETGECMRSVEMFACALLARCVWLSSNPRAQGDVHTTH
jgi:hypothetical protein